MLTKNQISICVILLSVLLNRGYVVGQIKSLDDSIAIRHEDISSHKVRKAFAVPVALLAAGFVAKTNNEVFSNKEFQEERNEYYPYFRTHADDYLQYVPIVAVYGLNAVGVKGKNDFANRTALLIKSEIIMTVITFSLKKIVAEPRPDTGEQNSFPSGHTAQAFVAATFMAKEYGQKSVWYSIGAYSVATSIGVLRVMNNRHWASDVLAGAGIGILSTNIAYLTHQYKWGTQKNAVVVMPSYSNKSGGIYFSYTFR
jgi:membrane-associated phospholipid phosphatase